MKNYILILGVCSFLFCVGNQTHASPGPGTHHELVSTDCLTVAHFDVMPVVHLEYGVAIHSPNIYFESDYYWTSHRLRIDEGSDASYVFLMNARYSIAYSMIN